MTRASHLLACVGLLALGAVVVPAAQRVAVLSNPQAILRTDIDGMTARLRGGHVPASLAIRDAQRLSAGYRSLVPHVGGFGPADYAYNREMARRSLYWLGRASVLYTADAVASRAFLDAYDSIGRFYRDDWRYYSPGAYVAYAGGARLARRLMLGSTPYDWSQRELDRYALAYGSLAVLDGRYVGRWALPQDLPDDAPQSTAAPPVLTPVDLPKVDTATLSPVQKQAWQDARDRFRSVSSQVHSARVLLEQLSARLQSQRLALHPANAAGAMKMQGFLEDAAELIGAKEFEMAVDALRRADYERSKLKSVTGQ